MERSLVNLVLKEFHDSPFSGNLLDRTREKGKTCMWWPMQQKDVAEYCKTSDRCQKANKYTGKRLGNMIKIQEPSRPWETVRMDWVTGLPPGGDKSYNACLVIFDRSSNTPIFLPCQKVDTAMDKALLIWNRVVSCTGIFTKIISDRDTKFTSALWANLHIFFGANLSFSTAYHPQAHGLAERIIQALEYMVRRKTSIHASTNQIPAVLEKGWNPRLPQDSLRKDLFELHPTDVSFKEMLEKARKNEVRCMEDSVEYAKDKWDKSHATPDFKVGYLVIVSTTNLNNIKGCKKLKESFAGNFVIKALHGENAVEAELSEELINKNLTFPISLIKPYESGDAEIFPLINKAPQNIPPVKSPGTKKITQALKERKLRSQKVRDNTLSGTGTQLVKMSCWYKATYLKLPSFSEDTDTIEITILQSNILF
ncbi:hypothetical protein O181_091243 [Austropuccinia psidii MF-1]|uniref:Integrase catalytic domain-containing protein n=1 Tax=Austropuccinia psidii MF-1 TaxID=1389203 RepID=A0A9Q3IWF5_9BASI|nr:hypothetical protein [Austropuccinia psidii MF-1]